MVNDIEFLQHHAMKIAEQNMSIPYDRIAIYKIL